MKIIGELKILAIAQENITKSVITVSDCGLQTLYLCEDGTIRWNNEIDEDYK